MDSVKGFTTGFDYLRLILSVSVLAWHSYQYTHGGPAAYEIANAWSAWLTLLILPMFFSLSGFLVASSLQRVSSLTVFAWHRVIRIVPALAVDVFLSALLLGPFLSELAPSDYFSSPAFLSYFWNVLGYIHFELPGVFIHSPVPNIVNGNLWTVPYELECYLVLIVLAVVGVTRRKEILLYGVVVLCVATAIYRHGQGMSFETIPPNVPGRPLVLCFLAGVALNLVRHRVPYRRDLAVVLGALALIMLRDKTLLTLAPLPVAYFTAWLGLHQPRKIPVLMDGDYSYGIYLYAVPIQQTVQQLIPMGSTYLGNLVISLVLVSLFAMFSWHVIEKPTLRLKDLFGTSAKKRLTGSKNRVAAKGSCEAPQ